MSILWSAAASTAVALSTVLVYRLVTHRGPHVLRRNRLRPVSVSDAQWLLVCQHHDFTDFQPTDFDDVHHVLQAAQNTLANPHEQAAPVLAQLADVGLWDTSDENNWDFVMTVDVSPLVRLASATIRIGPFAELGHGPDGARAVLNELLTERDFLISGLAKAIPA